MMIQPIITFVLLAILFFTLIQSRSGRILRTLMILSVLLGIVFTWMPVLSNEIAHYLGVGRGADLIFYIWILISMLALVALYFSFSRQNKQITELARALALHGAEANFTQEPKK
jgi:small membrane protein